MPKYQLWPKQVEDLAFFINNPRGCNFSDPGAGKTPITCVWFDYHNTYRGKKGVFTSPKALLVKNRNEFQDFTGLKKYELQIVDGSPRERASQMKNKDAKVFLMGYKRFADDWRYLLEHNPEIDAHASDEWHKGWKTDESARVMELYRAHRHITHLMPMTGSPIDGGLHTVYPLIRLCAPHFYPSIETFRLQHGIFDVEYGGIVGWKGHDKVKAILDSFSIRRTFEEMHGDEHPMITAEPCKQFKSQETAYSEMHEAGMTELDEYFLTASGGGVRSLRCRQLLAHPETFGLKGTNGRDEQLKEHLLNHKHNGKPLIIYSCFVPEQKRITDLVKSMGMTVQLLNGTVKNPEIDEQFVAGKFQVVVASQEVASLGYNWPHVDHIIFTSLDYSDSNFTQAYKRAIRGKRKLKLLVTILFYPHTTDRKVCAILDRKSLDSNKVIGSRVLNLRNAIDKATHEW